MAVTIKDVALKAGVNPSTVSRVIKDAPEISEKTKSKVRKAMSELGYTRNAAAQILASGKTNTIGVVFPPVVDKSSQPFFMKILTAINETARKFNISIAIATGHTQHELKKQVRLLYSERRVDGFIVLYAGKIDGIREYLMGNKIPFVLVGTPSDHQNEITHVDNDNELLGREAVRHLAGLGHNHIAFVTDTQEGEVFEERYQGFVDEMKKRNLTSSLLNFDQRFSYGNETAFVIMDDVLSLKVLGKLKEEGVRVPEDISLITFNNSVFGTIIHPFFTTFDINVTRLGAASVEKFLSLLNDNSDYHEKTVVPFKLILRESTQERQGEFKAKHNLQEYGEQDV
ncbi:LacI family DNA-binding transcriptional regulator [Lactovum miscens]|uniref:LacI family transcriptional regulator n=1 Tax=Lactovum miscens TaxID=190387 RepID=A0A841C7R0_9LACT|nr:LacI family DNA-binding transcriptional regulator [Lactovum miscens]MBB5888384.1 LacI family transcriptional regulator [Lactovum miscens]